MRKINGLNVLEKTDLEKSCPSFYATAPKNGVSDRYTFLSTHDIARQLWDEKWMPVYAREARSIDPTNRGVTRHVVRWAHKDFAVNGERIEIVGINSHNRASSFKFMAGIFRLVCSNGMVVKAANFGEFKIKHMGDIGAQVFDAVDRISRGAAKIAGRMGDFKTIDLSPNEQGVFASAAHECLYEKPEDAPIQADQLLLPRRHTDAGPADHLPKPDLWTTFNTVQENIIKGGLRGRSKKTGRRMKTRPVKAIDQDVKLNQALWSLTEKMAEIKKAA